MGMETPGIINVQTHTTITKPSMVNSQTSILSSLSDQRKKVQWFFNDMRVFIAFDVITSFFMGVVGSYYWVMTTSIEREFQLSGLKMGFLMNAWDIGRLPVLPVLSFFGGRYHIPRILGFMQILRGAAIALLVLPHFLFGENVIAMFKVSAMETSITPEHEAQWNGTVIYQAMICHPPGENVTADTGSITADIISNSNIAYGMFILSYVMFGIAFSAPGTLGIMYFDNNIEKSKLPLLLGIFGMVGPISSFVGGLLATWFSTMYVDLSEPIIERDDPRWISAWWLGLLITFVPPTILGPLICLFPRRMRKKGTIDISCITNRLPKLKSLKEEHESSKDVKRQLSEEEQAAKEVLEKEQAAKDEDEFKKVSKETYTIKEFPRALWRLLKNPVFIMVVLYYVLQDFAWSGWSSFAMKYYEQIFRVPVWKVTLINTIADLIVFPLGSMIGAIVITRLRPTFARAALLMIFTIVVWCVIGVGRMFITCGDSTYAGLNYTGPEQLMGECNAACECNLNAFSPVCDNGTTYFSPCHAGCEMGNITLIDGIIQPKQKDYYECGCTHSGLARPGRCEGECDLIYLYVGLRGISMLVWALAGSAGTLMLLRCLGYSEKAFGLGIAMCLSSLLGSMPSAPLIGKIIDGTCVVWQMIFGEQGNCWIHDTAQMRFRMYGWTLGFMTLQCFVLLIIYFLAKRRNLKLFDEDDPIELGKKKAKGKGNEANETGMEPIFNSGYSMDDDSNPSKIIQFNSVKL